MANSFASASICKTRMGQHEFAEQRVERKAMHARTDGEHQHRRGAIDRVTGADLARAGLQEIPRRCVLARARGVQDREHAAYRDV